MRWSRHDAMPPLSTPARLAPRYRRPTIFRRCCDRSKLDPRGELLQPGECHRRRFPPFRHRLSFRPPWLNGNASCCGGDSAPRAPVPAQSRAGHVVRVLRSMNFDDVIGNGGGAVVDFEDDVNLFSGLVGSETRLLRVGVRVAGFSLSAESWYCRSSRRASPCPSGPLRLSFASRHRAPLRPAHGQAREHDSSRTNRPALRRFECELVVLWVEACPDQVFRIHPRDFLPVRKPSAKCCVSGSGC